MESKDMKELNPDELEQVGGGLNGLEYFAHGNSKIICTCWSCGKTYEYAPGLNLNDPNDPWRHYCSAACRDKQQFYAVGNPRP